jgi:hypothetical protein
MAKYNFDYKFVKKPDYIISKDIVLKALKDFSSSLLSLNNGKGHYYIIFIDTIHYMDEFGIGIKI